MEDRWNKVNIKRKLIWLYLTTALIMVLVFVNLNVGSIGVTGAGNPSATTTFNTNITMSFTSGESVWLSNGPVIQFKNLTGGDVTAIRPGDRFVATVDFVYEAPLANHWYYVWGPSYVYSMGVAFKTGSYIGGTPESPTFTVSEVWNHFWDTPQNFTIFPPVPSDEFVEAELMIDSLVVDREYVILAGSPTVDSWWEITYPGDWAGSRFHINSTSWFFANINALLNATGSSVTSIPADPIPNEGFGGDELITKLESGGEYLITSPETLLPELGSWWDIVSPTGLSDISYNISSSTEGYFVIDTLWNNTAGAPISSLTIDPEKIITATLATGPKVDTIRASEWYNVIAGDTPTERSWWNITTTDPLNSTLIGTQFYVDIGGDGVFHIDETSENVTVSPAVDNVTAEELTPAIYMDPANIIGTEFTPGESFTISIKTNYTMNIWGYEFTLTYNPLVLNVTDITNGDLIPTGSNATFYTWGVDYTAGEIKQTGAKFNEHTIQTNGPGTLANVTFTVVGTGDSYLTLGTDPRWPTRLIRVSDGEEQNIVDDVTGQIEHCYFRNYEGTVVHDVAVTDVTFSVHAFLNTTIPINVTVLNDGTLSETFDVKVYYDQIAPNWLIETQTVSNLGGGASTILTINWDVTDAAYGSHTIKVKATVVEGETDTLDNTLVDGPILVVGPGDIDGDRDVDIFDIVTMSSIYGVSKPDPRYSPYCDLDDDGDIDIFDIVTAASNYGKTW